MDLVASDWQDRLPPYGLGIRLCWEVAIRAGKASPLTDSDRRQAAEGPKMARMELDAFDGERT